MNRAERNKLVLKNKGLVYKVAKNLNIYMDYQDMIQEGLIGLIKAVEMYNPKKCRQFSTYAHTCIYSHIMRAYQNKGHFIRIPVHVQEQYSKLKKVKGFTDMDNDKIYDYEYLSKETNIPIEIIKNVIEYCSMYQTDIEPLSNILPYNNDIDQSIDCKNTLSYIERKVNNFTPLQKNTYKRILLEGEKSPNPSEDNRIYIIRGKLRKLFNGVPECLK